MCYASTYMEAHFLLIFPLFFLSRYVSSKPLYYFSLPGTMVDIHGKDTIHRFHMISQRKTTMKQTLLFVDHPKTHLQPVPHNKKIKEGTGKEDFKLKAQRGINRIVGYNSNKIPETNDFKVNLKRSHNFSHFYRKKTTNFPSSLPRLLSKLTSLGKHNVPFRDVIDQSVAQLSHERTITPIRTAKLRKIFHVADDNESLSIKSDFDLVPLSQHLGNRIQVSGRHLGSRNYDLRPDRRADRTESTTNTLNGSVKISSQTAEKASRLNWESLSSLHEPLRSEGEQLEMRWRMSSVDGNDKIKSNNQPNTIYGENMERDRSEESRQRTFGLDQGVNMPSVQILREFAEKKSRDKSSNTVSDIYDHVEMMRKTEFDVLGGVQNGLPWRQGGVYPLVLKAWLDKDALVNSFETSDKDSLDSRSYQMDESKLRGASHSDQQLNTNPESPRIDTNHSNLSKVSYDEWYFGDLGEIIKKQKETLSQLNKLRLQTDLNARFGTHFKPSGDNQKTGVDKLGQWILNKRIDILERRTDTEWKRVHVSPSYFGQSEKVNLPRKNKMDSNLMIGRANAPPNIKFDYYWVHKRNSLKNDLIKKPKISLKKERVAVAGNKSNVTKTHSQQLLRKRRDLEGENNTITFDIATTLAITEKEDMTSFIEVTTMQTSVEPPGEVLSTEREIYITERTDDNGRSFMQEEKNSDKRGRVRDSSDSINLIVSIQSDSSILYIMPSMVLLTLLVLAVEGVRRWRTIQKARARIRLLPPSRGIDGDFTIENPLAFDPDVPSTSKSQPGSSSEDSGSPGASNGPFTISHTNEFPIFNTFPHRSRRLTKDWSSSFDSSRQCCCTWCLIKSNDVQTTRL